MPLFRSPVPALEVPVDTGKGPVIVLVHGIASTSITFDKLIPLLTPHARVIAVNLLGCGGSPAPDIDYTVDQHVASLRKTLIARGVLFPFTLVGHSMGGIISARFAATYGRWVKRLVLSGTPIYPDRATIINPFDRAQLGFYNDFYNFLKDNPAVTSTTAMALNALSPIPNILDVTERGWEATKRSMTNVIQRQSTLADLALVDAPVDLVYGTLDPFLSKVGTTAAARLSNVRSVPVDLGDHVIRDPMAKRIAELVLPPTARR